MGGGVDDRGKKTCVFVIWKPSTVRQRVESLQKEMFAVLEEAVTKNAES